MKKKLTKEELIQENARLTSELEEVTRDFNGYSKTALKNLGKTLGIYQENTGFYAKSDTLPDWSQVYARIGELCLYERLYKQSTVPERVEFSLE